MPLSRALPRRLSAPLLLAALALSLPAGIAAARDLHVAAGAGPDGDGSPERPFRSIRAAFVSGLLEDGDRLLLAPGAYGDVHVWAQHDRGKETQRTIRDVTVEGTVAPELSRDGADPAAQAAWFKRIVVHDAEGLTFRNLLLMPDPADPSPKARDGAIFNVHRTALRVALEDSLITSAPEAALETWTTKQDWRGGAIRTAIRLAGPEGAARGNRVIGVNFGIESKGGKGVIADNFIDRFVGDGLRALGDGSVVSGNTVQNCMKVSKNHNDAFQSWSVDENGKPGRGVVRDVTVSGNRLFEWNRPEPNPFPCRLQGIGLFDGIYENWTIENNLVVVDHWNGITVMGGRDVKVLNNTVMNPDPAVTDKPWIWMRPHKNKKSYEGNVVANNLAMGFRSYDKVVSAANFQVRYRGLVFQDAANGDYRLRRDGPAAGAALPRMQTPTDIEGRSRPASGGDLGAFEGS